MAVIEKEDPNKPLAHGKNQMIFDLPQGARDWLTPGRRHAFYLPPVLSASDELAAWDQLQDWDALAGRMLRASLFDDTSWLKPQSHIWCVSEQAWLPTILEIDRYDRGRGAA